jgi:hypothetical protein
VNWWVVAAIVVIVVVGLAIANRVGWIDLSDKSRRKGSGSIGSGILSVGDEIFAPTRHEANVQQDRETQLPAPAPVAGDGDKGIFHDGPVRIKVDRHGHPVDSVTRRRR